MSETIEIRTGASVVHIPYQAKITEEDLEEVPIPIDPEDEVMLLKFCDVALAEDWEKVTHNCEHHEVTLIRR